MNDQTLIDAQERHAIASDLDTTFLVEAAAGTGKTTSLVTRMTALIRQGKTDAAKMAAITFTRKAAAHLRQKFQNTLERAHADEQDPAAKARLAAALGQLDRCYVGTIHSFCAQLLRERPVEAGVDPEFSELEDSEDSELSDRCWHDYVQRLFANESPLLPEMELYGITFADLRATYDVLCLYPDVVPHSEPVPRPDLSACRPELNRFLDAAERELPSEPPLKGWDDLQKLLHRALRMRRILDLQDDIEIVRLLDLLDAKSGLTQNRWSDKDIAKSMHSAFEDLRDRVVRPYLCRWREYLHSKLMEAVVPAVESLTRYRRENGLLNFQDLLMLARDLLRDHPHIRMYFRKRYTHLLVDEFQDTDPVQAELMLFLAAGDPEEADWRRIRPIAGALFVVGDPKQSIYRFRRADIVTYNRVREIIEESGGRVLKLSTNFRSLEGICSLVNTSFEDVFPAEATEEQAAHVPLHPVRPDMDAFSGVFRLEFSTSQIKSMCGVQRANNEQKISVDSACIADWIRNALESGLSIPDDDGCRPARPGDFLIVLHRKKLIGAYAQALEARGIPYEISGSEGFAESADIAMLLPFLKSVVDPDDPVSLLAYLRGPLCGVSDTALYAFKRIGGRFAFTSSRPAGADESIVGAFELLKEAREISRKLSPAAALSRICEGLGLIPHAAVQEFGDTRGGNLLRLLALSRKLSAGGSSFAGIVAHVEQLGENGKIDDMSTEPGRPDAVRLMNLHKSKGLEAPVVFLAGPIDPRDHAPGYLVDRSADPPKGYFLITKEYGEHARREIARPTDWDAKASIESRFQRAEDERLLYVAATRPMNALVISSFFSESGSNPGSRGPWVGLLSPDVPALPRIEHPSPVTEDVVTSDLGHGLAEFRGELQGRLECAAAPSYAVTQVSKAAHTRTASRGMKTSDGHGAAWGRVLHGCLEALMRNSTLDTRLLVANAMREEEMPLDEIDEIVRLADAVRASDLWKQACSAEQRLVEVPFAVQVSSADLGVSGGPAETTLRGTIDLAFRDASGWTIVDYKSDVVGSRLQSLIEFYSPQVRCYRKYWEELTGESACAALLFIDGGHVEWL